MQISQIVIADAMLDEPKTLREKFNRHGKNGANHARARGKGQVSPEIAKKLAELLTADDLEQAVQALRDGLVAEKEVYDPKAREWITQPDRKERRESALAIIAYLEGRPIERSVVATMNAEDFEGRAARVLATRAGQHVLTETCHGNSVPRIIDTQSEKLE